MQTISDPRQYSLSYPNSNIVINKALNVANGQININDLEQIIIKLLQQENDATINIALNLAPSALTSQLIWQALTKAINCNINGATVTIFAIPIILVAGSKIRTNLKAQLNTDELNQFFFDNQIFSMNSDSFISGKLINQLDIAKIKPSQLYYWTRNLPNAKLWLPIELLGSEIEILNEGVFLRFLIGVTNTELNLAKYNENSINFMQKINKELKKDEVTLFPIPFAPVKLSQAYAIGDNYRKEIAIQVAVSNIVRKIRENNQTPKAMISAANGIIKLTIISTEDSNLKEISLWHMNQFDDFESILEKITSLLQDIPIEWSYTN